MSDLFVLNITWDRPGLPSLVGPFGDRAEAHQWAEFNIPNGSFEVCPLAYPYLRDGDGNHLFVSLPPQEDT